MRAMDAQAAAQGRRVAHGERAARRRPREQLDAEDLRLAAARARGRLPAGLDLPDRGLVLLPRDHRVVVVEHRVGRAVAQQRAAVEQDRALAERLHRA
jgi:hypothetical protein